MNGVKRFKKTQRERESIGKDEFKWKIGLGLNVHADNLKPGAAVPNGNAARAAKQIKKLKFHFPRNNWLQRGDKSKEKKV